MEDLPMHFLFELKGTQEWEFFWLRWRLQEVGSGSAPPFVSGIGTLFRKKWKWFRIRHGFVPPAKNYRFYSLFLHFSQCQRIVLAILFTSIGPHERSLAPRSPPTTSPPQPTRKDLENLTSGLGQIRHFLTSGPGQQRCLPLPQVNNLFFSLWKV